MEQTSTPQRTQRTIISTKEEFLALPADHQQKWRSIVMAAVVVSGVTDIISPDFGDEADGIFDELTGQLETLAQEEFTKNYLSDEVESMILLDGARDLLKHLNWSF